MIKASLNLNATELQVAKLCPKTIVEDRLTQDGPRARYVGSGSGTNPSLEQPKYSVVKPLDGSISFTLSEDRQQDDSGFFSCSAC